MVSGNLLVKDLVVQLSTGKRIVGPVSFEVQTGERLGIVGVSGAGKTTVLKAISGLLPPHFQLNGTVKFADGPNLLGLSPKQRLIATKMGITTIVQNAINSLNPFQTIKKQLFDTINLGAKTDRTHCLTIAKQALTEVSLSPQEVLNKYPHQLSGGMTQRVAIALSLLGPKRLVLADEPTTSLDVIRQQEFSTLLNKICQSRQITLIYVSHDLALISQLCNQVAIISAGNIVERGLVSEIFSKPKTKISQQLVRETRLMSLP